MRFAVAQGQILGKQRSQHGPQDKLPGVRKATAAGMHFSQARPMRAGGRSEFQLFPGGGFLVGWSFLLTLSLHICLVLFLPHHTLNTFAFAFQLQ